MEKPPLAILQRSLIYLEFKYSELLLARIAPENSIQRSHCIKAAFEMLDCILELWAKRDLLVDFQWLFGVVVISPPFERSTGLT